MNRAALLFRRSRGRCVLLPFVVFRGHSHSSAYGPLCPQCNQRCLSLTRLPLLHLPLTSAFLPLINTIEDALGPPGLSRIIFLLKTQLTGNLNFFCNLNSPLPCKLTHSQVLGIWAQTSSGGSYSAYRRENMPSYWIRNYFFLLLVSADLLFQ